jgi:tetratricopeptide (TPR) repeat protein
MADLFQYLRLPNESLRRHNPVQCSFIPKEMSMKPFRSFDFLWLLPIVSLTLPGLVSVAQDREPAKKPEVTRERFDGAVREDFFAGFDGDADRLAAGMKKCEEVLAEDEKNAEAMVWLGSGEVYLSGRSFQKGDVVKGMGYWQKGFDRMNKAAELEPDNIGVLIPRAAVLMPASRGMPNPMKGQVLQSVLKDFTRVYELQKDSLDKLGEHPLGELRMGLADIYRSMGDMDNSRIHLEAIKAELPGTDYANRADEWLIAKPTAKLAHTCIGCHSN